MTQFIFAITEFQNNKDRWLFLPQTGSHVLCSSPLIFFSILLYLVRGLKMSEGDLCQNKKRSLFYSLGVSFGSHSNYIPQLSFEFLMD